MSLIFMYIYYLLIRVSTLFYIKKKQNSGVKISKVSYEHIRGTSACPQAINLDCSKSNPCEGIKLQDIDLVYGEGSTTSTCNNVGGINSGVVIPKSCLSLHSLNEK